jgi:NADH-quinone oxidoreductase subunit C
MDYSLLVDKLKINDFFIKIDIIKGELIAFVNKDNIIKALDLLKNTYQFHLLINICAVDYPHHKKRFTIVYNLLNIIDNLRIRINIEANEDEMILSSIETFKCAMWYEREVWDMFGILFLYNHDMRRILTDYEFQGHPFRKDFPLSGYHQVEYDHKDNKVKYGTVKLEQEYRDFDYMLS